MITDLASAKEFFKDDRFATDAAGIEIVEARENYAKVRLTIGPRHLNAAGRVMGAVYFTMADFAFAVAANFNRPLTLTTDSQIHFLAAAKGDTLIAETQIVSDKRHTCYAQTQVRDGENTLIAAVTAGGYRPQVP